VFHPHIGFDAFAQQRPTDLRRHWQNPMNDFPGAIEFFDGKHGGKFPNYLA
jgi:hypothetical protein